MLLDKNEKPYFFIKLLIVIAMTIFLGACTDNEQATNDPLSQYEDPEAESTANSDSSNASNASNASNESNESNVSDRSQNEAGNSGLLLTLLTFLSICLVILLFLVVFLFRWRRLERGGQYSLVPNDLMNAFGQVRSDQSKYNSEIQQQTYKTEKCIAQVLENVEGLRHSYSSFQQALDRRDSEIERLRQGYDWSVMKRVLRQVAELARELEKEIAECESDKESERIKDIHELFLDRLEEFDIERYEPPVGEPIKTAACIDERYNKISTDDPNEHLTIASVKLCGFLMKQAEHPLCILPAKVNVYIKSDNESEVEGENKND